LRFFCFCCWVGIDNETADFFKNQLFEWDLFFYCLGVSFLFLCLFACGVMGDLNRLVFWELGE